MVIATNRSPLYERCLEIINSLDEKLYLPENVTKKAVELLDKVIKDDEIRLKIQGRKPTSIAASLVYIAANIEGFRLTQREIMEAFGYQITEGTITKNYKELLALMGMSDLIK